MEPVAYGASPPDRVTNVKRVLMTADAVGGVWPYAVQLAALLSNSRGVRVMLAVMGPSPSGAQLDEAAAVDALTVRSRPYALEWVPGAWPEVDAAGDWLLSLSQEFAPDIIHLNGYCHADLEWSAPTVVVAHSCVCSWWDAVHGGLPPAEWSVYADRVRRGLRAASAVVAPSASMSLALEVFYGHADARIIPNARSGRAWRPAGKEPIVFAAGRVWDPGKNLAVLDRVAASLRWPVYVAGDAAGSGSSPAGLSHMHLLGPITSSAVANWMARAAIYAFPARYEPFGLSVLEAALSGCALVLGDIPSLRENWSGVARFVAPDDPAQLRAVIEELIEHPVEREAMGRAARSRAALFTPERHVDAYHSVYGNMATHHDRVAHPTRPY